MNLLDSTVIFKIAGDVATFVNIITKVMSFHLQPETDTSGETIVTAGMSLKNMKPFLLQFLRSIHDILK